MLRLIRRFFEASRREHERIRLHAALNNIAHGVCFFDKAHRLIVCNRSYIELYRLPPEKVKPGTSLKFDSRDKILTRFAEGSVESLRRGGGPRSTELTSGIGELKNDNAPLILLLLGSGGFYGRGRWR